MPWTIETFQKPQWYQSVLVWIAVAITVVVGLLAVPRAQGVYLHWREARRIARAETALASGDYRKAIMDAKPVVALNPHHIEATRIIAQALEALDAPQALLVRRRLDTLAGGDAENSLAIAAGSWKAGDPASTERALADVPAEARESAAYHELAARVAASRQDTTRALEHWQEAVRRAPTNRDYALALAVTRLNSKASGNHEAGVAQLEQLATDAATSLAARRALLSDADARGEKSRAFELSAAVIADPAATFADRLQHLGILRHGWHPDFAPFLTELQAAAAGTPEQLYALIVWMNGHDLALAVPEWTAKLPPEALAEPAIRAALADADARGSNWTGLKARLAGEQWEEFEFLRHAQLSRALGRLGDERGAAAAWANALAGAHEVPRRLEVLSRTVLEWGWNREAEEALWKRAGMEMCPRWVAEYLWAAARKDSDTTRLYEAARLLLLADPKSTPARKNFTALALLTGRDGDSPRHMAKALHEEHPDDPLIAATYGLALHQQGRAAEAVQVMANYPAAQLHQPLVALYHGIFLAGAGRFADAQEYLTAAATAPMLPEERALCAKARSACTPIAPNTTQRSPVGALDRSRRDTRQLYHECRQAFLADSTDLRTRSNYLELALLIGQSADSARALARVLHKEQPGDATAARIHGLALYQEGRANEAVAVMETLSPAQLREPLVALYYARFLDGSDFAPKAPKYFALAENAMLFPEEDAFLKSARPASTTISVSRP